MGEGAHTHNPHQPLTQEEMRTLVPITKVAPQKQSHPVSLHF